MSPRVQRLTDEADPVTARTLALAALAVALSGALALYAFRQSHGSTEVDAARAQSPEPNASPLTIADSVASELDTATADSAAADGSDVPDRPQAVVPEAVLPSLTELMLRDVQLPPPLLQAQQTFAAEPVDAAWAEAAEARILNEIAGLTGRPLISLQVECRSTVCRLQIVERDLAPPADRASAPNRIPEAVSATVKSMNDLVIGAGLEQRGAISVPDRSGTRILLAYLGREGA